MHSSLGYLTPAEFVAQVKKEEHDALEIFTKYHHGELREAMYEAYAETASFQAS